MFVNHMGVGRVAFGHGISEKKDPITPEVDNGYYCNEDDGDGNTSHTHTHTQNGGNQCSIPVTASVLYLSV